MNKKLSAKIEELFHYREFPRLFKIAGHDHSKHPLWKQLKDLQAQIYFLDHHLESNWEINAKKDLKPYWNNIYSALIRCGVKKRYHDDYCKLIYKYQKHELYLREGKLPIRFDMEYYYYFKSCDVKLLRRIIGDHFPEINKLFKSSDWRLFDLITEVNDDIEDIFEDTKTINGNYFLISYLKRGDKATKKAFGDFIKEIKARDKSRLTDKGLNYKWCSHLTQRACNATMRLMKANLESFSKDQTKVKLSKFI